MDPAEGTSDWYVDVQGESDASQDDAYLVSRPESTWQKLIKSFEGAASDIGDLIQSTLDGGRQTIDGKSFDDMRISVGDALVLNAL